MSLTATVLTAATLLVLALGEVMFDNGQVLKFETSAEYFAQAADFEVPSK